MSSSSRAQTRDLWRILDDLRRRSILPVPPEIPRLRAG
jgi:hypothetical protein